MVAQEVFLTKGVGKHKEKLASFELALRDGLIANFNLVRVSSIFPPNCKIIPKKEGLKQLQIGQVLHVVLSENATNEPNRLVAASIGVAMPTDKSRHGYLSEHHSYGQTEKLAGEYAEDLAAYMLATTLGIPYDENVTYDARKDMWKMQKHLVRTRSIAQSARGNKNGLWTTVITACVLVL